MQKVVDWIQEYDISPLIKKKLINNINYAFYSKKVAFSCLYENSHRDLMDEGLITAIGKWLSSEKHKVLHVKGLPLFNISTPTPTMIKPNNKQYLSLTEILFILIAKEAGDIFTYSSIQHGNIVNDIFPIKKNKDKKLSSNYEVSFEWHTEDAFLENPEEYLALFCLKNQTNTPIELSVFRSDWFSLDEIALLATEKVIIPHNPAHNLSKKADKPITILFGDNKDCFRFNSNYPIEYSGGDYDELISKIKYFLNSNSVKLMPKPGDFILIKNHFIAHRREAYRPLFDGNDRWLKRLYISKDLSRIQSVMNEVRPRVFEVFNA